MARNNHVAPRNARTCPGAGQSYTVDYATAVAEFLVAHKPGAKREAFRFADRSSVLSQFYD